jgi:Holliday junction resolvase RusA-like endonuclease
LTEHHFVTIEVIGKPASYSSAGTDPWKAAVRSAIAATHVSSQVARFAVKIVFRLGPSHNANEVWDLDNLVKPTLDAMEGVFGLRQWQGKPQAADDRVDRIEAVKRQPGPGETPGATIEVWVIQ